MESIITNKFNSLPQQVWENKNNIEILNHNLQKYILNYRGTYSNNAVYKENDVVVFGSETYVHVYEAETSGQNPIEYPNIWKLYIAGASLLARVGETTTLPSGSEATVSIKKVVENNLDIFEFSFGIPQGIKGADGTDGTDGKNGTDGTNGKDGQSAEITNVTVTATTGEQTSGNVIMGGTALARTFDFYFTLEKGEKGADGATPTFTGVNINVTELDPSQTAYGNAFINQTSPNVYELLLTFGIPKGNAGINTGEIVNVGSADSAEKTYSVTFLNAFANQVQTSLQGLGEFQTTVENNALYANNTIKTVSPQAINVYTVTLEESEKSAIYLVTTVISVQRTLESGSKQYYGVYKLIGVINGNHNTANSEANLGTIGTSGGFTVFVGAQISMTSDTTLNVASVSKIYTTDNTMLSADSIITDVIIQPLGGQHA